jgi:hypothetical protein
MTPQPEPEAMFYCNIQHPWLDEFRETVRLALFEYTDPTRNDPELRDNRIAELQEVRRIGAPFKNLLGEQYAGIADQLNTLPIGLHREITGALIDAVSEGLEVQFEIVHVEEDALMPDGSRAGDESASFVSTRTVYFGDGSRARVVRLGLSKEMLRAMAETQPAS